MVFLKSRGKPNVGKVGAEVIRLRFILFSFCILFLLIIIRLFTWQVVRAGVFARLGLSQQIVSASVPASRGSILASDGYPMAISSAGWLVWANPQEIDNPSEIAKLLAPMLAPRPSSAEADVLPSARAEGQATNDDTEEPIDKLSIEEEQEILIEKEEERLYQLLTRQGARWVSLAQKVPSETKKRIEELGLSGIGFDPDEARAYTEGSMAAHVLGFVGKDTAGVDVGYFGIEGRYDIALSGASGKRVGSKDALGNPVLAAQESMISAQDGVIIQTHIDRTIQYIVEKNLTLGLLQYGASAGTVIVMRPSDGAVLAMASLPAYEPERFGDFSEGDFVNPAISQSFEPGSIFKVVVMAAAIDAGVVRPQDKCDRCDGPRRIAEYTLRTWNNEYNPGITPGEILKYSNNVGMIWVAEKLGREKFYDYIANFGFGSLTGIDLQGESTPSLRARDTWGLVDLATASFGQGIAVTPIQMIRGVSAIANGGRLPTPQVVDKLVGGWEEDIKPDVDFQVISPQAAREVTEMMVEAAKDGEAKWTARSGFSVAGKTGTAQIPVKGHYDEEKTIASFIGFAPAEDPEFIMLVTLREPQSSPWAAETAAPLWFNIADELFLYFGIFPE